MDPTLAVLGLFAFSIGGALVGTSLVALCIERPGWLSSRIATHCFFCRRYTPWCGRHHTIAYNWNSAGYRKRVMICELCLLTVVVEGDISAVRRVR